DGQGRIDKKIPDWFSTLAFGILPLLCLLSTVLSGKLPEWFGFIPEQEAQPYHPYWAFVRFYPLVLTALCLAMAFKAAAKPRKYMKKKRALKFLMLALPYAIVMIYSELSLKSGLVEEGLDKTIGEGGLNLGALGVNVQLILALMTGSRLE